MPRFRPTPDRPSHLVASIVALAEQTNKLALDAAMDATGANAQGNLTAVVEHVCRLAVAAAVSAGEIAWLVDELHDAGATAEQLGEAAVAVSSMQTCMSAIAEAVRDMAGPTEVDSCAEALRRVAAQLAGLLPRLQPCG